MQLFTLGNSKIEVFETCCFDIVTTQYDPPSYVKHVFRRSSVFFTLFGYWVHGGGGGAPRRWVHDLLMKFFTLGGSKIEVFETFFGLKIVFTLDSPKSIFRNVFFDSVIT